IGVIKREHATRLAAMLKPGQRLVSREGDLWRWDGFSVAADAPAGAARRLAGKNRLAEIEADLASVRPQLHTNHKPLTTPHTRPAPRARARDAGLGAGGERGVAARPRQPPRGRARGGSRNAARLSALREAAARLTANRDEATAGRDEAQRALKALPPAANIETQ